MTDKLNFLEASFLIIVVVITHIILEFPNEIIKSTGSSAVLNIVYVTLLSILFFLFVEKLLKPFKGEDILYVAEYVGGKYLKRLLAVIYIIYFILISSIIIRGFSATLNVVYFPKAPIFLIVISFILTSVIAVLFGSRNVVKANTLLVPIILFTMVIVFVSSFKNFNISRFYPIFGKGVNETFGKGISNIYVFGEMIYIYLIIPHLRNIKDFKKVGVLSIILSALYLICSVVSIMMLLPFVSSGIDALSVYLSTKTIKLGHFMPRSDTMFIFIWIFNFLLYTSVILLYIGKVYRESFELKKKDLVIYISATIIFLLAIIPQNPLQILFFKNTIYKALSIIIVFILSPLILIAGNIKYKVTNNTNNIKNNK